MAKFSDNAIQVSGGKLTKKERTKLEEHCSVIDRWVDGWHEIGARMAAIRDDRLYRETHATFEAFCQERWGVGKAYAYRLIGCSEVHASLSPMGDISPPRNERQARELIDLDENQRADVWVKANELAEQAGKEVTAKIVAEVKRELFPPEEPETANVIDGKSVDVTPDDEASHAQFVDTIKILLKDGGKVVQREIYDFLRAKFEPKPQKKKDQELDPIPDNLNKEQFRVAWCLWKQYRKEKKQSLKPSTVRLQLKKLGALSVAEAVDMIEHSIEQGYTGLFPRDKNGKTKNGKPKKSNIRRYREPASS